MLRELLTEMGLKVHVAGTRNEAMSFIRSNHYALITLDMQLGPDDELGQEGVFLLDRLKRYQQNVPVIIISCLPWDKKQTRDFFVVHGIRDMLDKPFDQDQLRALVKKYVLDL